MRLAIVGATGLVGNCMLKVLEERNTPLTELIPIASEKSIGKTALFRGKDYPVLTVDQAVDKKPDAALFSAGSEVSLKWAPRFAEKGTYVIDNSSAWRMDEKIKLIVPEVNAHILDENDRIIANPNCSTIQMVVVLAPLHRFYQIKRLVVSTYQSVSGTGMKAVKQMENERSGLKGEMAYVYPIDKNCFPHGGSFLENGYTTEEMKLINETKKILHNQNISITATIARIPVYTGHSESVNVQFHKSFDVNDIRKILGDSPGITVMDDPLNNIYPTPLIAEGKDDVFVGRIRRDESTDNGLNLWIVSDNLRKGAATNAIQILEYLREQKFI